MRFWNKLGSLGRMVALAAVAGLCAGLPVASQVFFLPNNAAVSGHLNNAGGPPVGTGCTIAAGSSDFSGSCLTTATSGSIVFAAAYLTAPDCVLVDRDATPVAVYASTVSQITLTTVTSGHNLYWICAGRVGG